MHKEQFKRSPKMPRHSWQNYEMLPCNLKKILKPLDDLHVYEHEYSSDWNWKPSNYLFVVLNYKSSESLPWVKISQWMCRISSQKDSHKIPIIRS